MIYRDNRIFTTKGVASWCLKVCEKCRAKTGQSRSPSRWESAGMENLSSTWFRQRQKWMPIPSSIPSWNRCSPTTSPALRQEKTQGHLSYGQRSISQGCNNKWILLETKGYAYSSTGLDALQPRYGTDGFRDKLKFKKKCEASRCARSCSTGTCGSLWVVEVKNRHNSTGTQILAKTSENHGK